VRRVVFRRRYARPGLQERLARIIEAAPKEIISPLKLVTPDLQEAGMLNLGEEEDQDQLDAYLTGIDLIIADNISTLCRTGKENEAEGWLPVQGWALRQRAQGRSVLFIHHSGKGGAQRGTSKREDVLDTVISLKGLPTARPKTAQFLSCTLRKPEVSIALMQSPLKPHLPQMSTVGNAAHCAALKTPPSSGCAHC
jgi:hypothetical protein